MIVTDTLTISDVNALAEIVAAAKSTAKIAWVSGGGGTHYGTARAITNGDGPGFITSDTDLRDGYLWITTDMGWELWVPVRDLMQAFIDGTFSRYDW
jgi:hypothetical protein